MVKNSSTIDRGTKIRLGRWHNDDQADNTIVINASDTPIQVDQPDALYMKPIRTDERDSTLMTGFNINTFEIVNTGLRRDDVAPREIDYYANIGNTLTSTLLFTGDRSFTTTGTVGISNIDPIHTLDVGTKFYVDENNVNVLTVLGNTYVQEDLVVGGSLNVIGTVTAIDTVNTTVKDAIIEIGKGNVSSDMGIIMDRPGTNVTLGYREVVDEFVIAYTDSSATSSAVVPSSELIDVRVHGRLHTNSNLTVDTNTFHVDAISGHVGIHTVTPQTDLDVVGAVAISSNLTVDTNTLHIDSTTARVGINTLNPTTDFHVEGETYVSGNVTVDTDTFHVDTVNTRVGINTLNPTTDFHVEGETYISGNVTVDTNTLHVDTVNTRVGVNTLNPSTDFHVEGLTYISSNLTVDTDTFHVDAVQDRVGINTLNPQTDFDVVGKVAISSDLSVDTNTLHVDASSSRVGINTLTPSTDFHVEGETYVSGNVTVDTDTFHVDTVNDRVGINTLTPTTDFHVEGDTYVSGNVDVNTDLTVTGNAYMSSNIIVTGNADVLTDLNVTGNAYMQTDLTVTGNAYMTSNIVVTGNADVQTDLNVTGNAYMLSNIVVTGNADVKTDLNVTGNAYMLSNIVVTGNADVQTDLNVTGNAYVYSNAVVTGNVDVQTDLNVIGNGYMQTDLTVTGNAYMSSNIVVTGNADVQTNLNVATDAIVTGNVVVQTDLTVNGNAYMSSNVIVTGLNVTTDAIVTGNIDVQTDLIVTGNVDVQTDLTVTGNAYMSSNIMVTGNADVQTDLNVTGNAYMLSNIVVTGNADVQTDLNVMGNAYVSSNAVVTGNVDVQTDLNVIGNAYMQSDLTVTGNAYMSSNIVVTGNADVQTDLNVTGNAYMLSNIVVTGNADIQTDLHVIGNAYVSSNAVITGNVDIQTDLNVTGNAYVSSNAVVTGNVDVKSELNVTGNVFVDSNVIVVGNVHAATYYGDGGLLANVTLQVVSDHGNVTSNTIQFTNPTTGLVTVSNVNVGDSISIGNLTVNKIPIVGTGNFLEDSSISKVNGSIVISSDVEILGNVIVVGNSYTLESESLVINDRVIGIANNNVSHELDVGIIMQHPGKNVALVHHGVSAGDDNPHDHTFTIGYTQNTITDNYIFNDSNLITVEILGNLITQNNLTVSGTVAVVGASTFADDLTVGAASNLFVDVSTSRVGINEATPDASLDVNGDVLIQSTVDASSTTSGALRVSGGVGVVGNVYATRFVGDGAFLENIASNLEQITENGNVTTSTIQFTNATTSLVTLGSVGIANTAPIHDLDLGSNLFMEDTGSNVVHVTGNIYATRFIGDGAFLENIASNLEQITENGNVTTGTIQFTNTTTSLVTLGSVGIANTAPIHDLNVGSNLYIEDVGSNVVHVTGNIYATRFIGDGAFLENIASNLEQITENGNVTTGTIQFTNAATALITTGKVGISTSNPDANLHVTGNVYVSSNVEVAGNVIVDGGLIVNRSGLTKKTYGYSGGVIANGTTPEINVVFDSQLFSAKITAHLIEPVSNISVLNLDVMGGTGRNIGKGFVSIVGDQNSKHWDSVIATNDTTVTLKPSIGPIGAGSYGISVEYTSPLGTGGVTSIDKDNTNEITFDY